MVLKGRRGLCFVQAGKGSGRAGVGKGELRVPGEGARVAGERAASPASPAFQGLKRGWEKSQSPGHTFGRRFGIQVKGTSALQSVGHSQGGCPRVLQTRFGAKRRFGVFHSDHSAQIQLKVIFRKPTLHSGGLLCLFGLNSPGFGSRAEETTHFYKIPKWRETSALSTKHTAVAQHYLLSKSRKTKPGNMKIQQHRTCKF